MAFKDILLTQANYPGPTVLAVTARNLRAAFDAAATKAGLLHDPVSRNARPSPYRTYWSIELRDLTIVPGIGERRGVRDIRIAPVCSVSARTSARFRLNLEPPQGLGLSSTAARGGGGCASIDQEGEDIEVAVDEVDGGWPRPIAGAARRAT
jgi:hypothetical protein